MQDELCGAAELQPDHDAHGPPIIIDQVGDPLEGQHRHGSEGAGVRPDEHAGSQLAGPALVGANATTVGSSKVFYQAYTNQAQSIPQASLLPAGQKRASTSRIFLGQQVNKPVQNVSTSISAGGTNTHRAADH